MRLWAKRQRDLSRARRYDLKLWIGRPLDLLDNHRFGNGVVYLRYDTRT